MAFSTAADNLERSALVQDRSVHIIKQVIVSEVKELRKAVARATVK